MRKPASDIAAPGLSVQVFPQAAVPAQATLPSPALLPSSRDCLSFLFPSFLPPAPHRSCFPSNIFESLLPRYLALARYWRHSHGGRGKDRIHAFVELGESEAKNKIVQLHIIEGAECSGGIQQSVEDGELFFVVGEREIHSFNGTVGLMENGRFEQRLEG